MKTKKDLSKDIVQGTSLEWKVNTPGLIQEIANNNSQMAFLRVGLQIFMTLLGEVGECAARINDDELNGLMCRLAIYEISDPYNDAFDKELLEKTIEKYKTAKKNRKQ